MTTEKLPFSYTYDFGSYPLAIASVINAELYAQGHDKTWLIKETGLSPLVIEALLCGDKKNSLDDLSCCCQALRLPVHVLFTRADELAKASAKNKLKTEIQNLQKKYS